LIDGRRLAYTERRAVGIRQAGLGTEAHTTVGVDNVLGRTVVDACV